MKIKSNLKTLLGDKSIRQFAKETGLPFETLRRLYNDETERYQRDTLARVCETLNVGIDEVLLLVNDEE
ncbi:hypothetical protein ACA30_15810 [Virgibacillus soli]|nr:hypothetical protein ACA30_15810 [Virgibacillus soli]